MKCIIIALICCVLAVEIHTRLLDNGLQAGKFQCLIAFFMVYFSMCNSVDRANFSVGPFIQSWRTFLYKVNGDVASEHYPLVQELIDLSYPLERVLSSGDSDGITETYRKTLIIANKLLPFVRDSHLRTVLTDRIMDFERVVGKLQSGETDTNNIQSILNNVAGAVADVATVTVGTIHHVVKSILDTIFGAIHLYH